MRILWLRPDKPENISVGRHRLAAELESRGHSVKTRNTTRGDFKAIINENPDVIVGTTRLGAFVGAWKRIISGTPLVVDHIDPISQFRRSHGPTITWSVSQAEKFTFRLADHVSVVYEKELPRANRYASAVTHTALGVDYERFAHPSAKTIQKARQIVSRHVPDGANVVLYVGGLEPSYNISTVIKAMNQLKNWHFVVLGDGSQRDWLDDISDENDSVHYLGTVPYEEVPGYMHVADVGVNLIDDANTLKVLEYGASELPVVHVEGDASQVFDGMVSFCSLDPASVAHAIESAPSIDTKPLREFAHQHKWKNIASQYEQILVEVTESS